MKLMKGERLGYCVRVAVLVVLAMANVAGVVACVKVERENAAMEAARGEVVR